MALNPFDQTLEDVDKESRAPAAQANPFDLTLEDMGKASETQMRGSLEVAQGTTPDTRAEALRLKERTGLPVDVIERNIDDIRKRAQIADTPYAQMMRETPVLAESLKDPDFAAIAHDDLENLGALEWLTTAPQRAVAQGINQVRFAQLKTESMFRSLSRDEEDLLDSYRYHMELGGALGAGDSWWRKSVTGAGQLLPNIAGGAAMALKYGVAGAIETGLPAAAVGSVLPGFGTVASGLAGGSLGFRAGALYGGAKMGFQLEAGLALDEYEKFTDESGRPIDGDVAKAAALATGLMNAGLEAYGLEKLAESIPGVKSITRYATRDAVKEALKRPTVRAGLAAAMKSYAGTLTAETATEVAQRAATILSGELAKTASGQTIAHRTGASIFEDLINEGVGAVQSFGLTVAAGPVMQAAQARQQAQAAQGNVDFFRDLGTGMAASKAVERAPEAVQQLIGRAVAAGPVPNVYAPTDTWVTYWQSKGVDPAEVAAKVTGNPRALEEAQVTGNLTIPTERYAVQLAPTEHNEFLASELRMAPDEMNTREALAFQEAEVAKAQQDEQAHLTPRDQIRQQMQARLEGAAVPAATAAPLAQLVEAGVGQMVESAGLDPFEVYQRYGITVARPTSGEAAPAQAVKDPEATGSELAAQAPEQPLPLEAIQQQADAATSTAARSTYGPAMREIVDKTIAANAVARGTDVDVPDNPAARALEAMRRRDLAAYLSSQATGSTVDTGVEGAQTSESQVNGDRPQAGQGPQDAPREQLGADGGGQQQSGGDGARTERRRLPTSGEIASVEGDAVFTQASKEEDAARLTPEVARELQRIADELGDFPYTAATWNFDVPDKSGNAAGGDANIVGGAAGAPVYDDILRYSPLNKSSKKGRGAANTTSRERDDVEIAIRKAIAAGRINSNIAEGAVRVAERRAIEDYRDISRPILPPSWGDVAGETLISDLSEGIDKALEEGDASFDPTTFGQAMLGLFDNAENSSLAPARAALARIRADGFEVALFNEDAQKWLISDDRVSDNGRSVGRESKRKIPPAVTKALEVINALDMETVVTLINEKVDTLSTGEQQPRLPGAENVRDQNVATPELEVPFSLTGETSKATKGKQTTLFQSAQRTAAFKRWFGASKVVDQEGNPLVVHHGTARGDRVGNVFRKGRATSGPMAFFTTDREIATKYSNQKQDTSFEQPDDYRGWFKFKPQGSRSEVDLDRAWWHLSAAERATVLERLPTVGYQDPDQATGSIVADSDSIASADHIAHLLKEQRGNGLAAAKELWLSSGALFDQEEQFLDVLNALGLEGKFRFDDPHATNPKVYDVYLSIQNPLDTSAIPDKVFAALEKKSRRQRAGAEFGADMWDKRTRDPKQWIDQLKQDIQEGNNSFVWSSIPDWVTSTLKDLGFDGIKDTGGKMGGETHAVWIPFEPNQIKATANVGTFDPSTGNIYKQDRRGAITFGADRKVSIDLFEKADLSTFLHETGHFFLELFGDLVDEVAVKDPASLTDQQRRLLNDYGVLLKQLGVEGRKDIGEQQHETFARMFEAYLREGKAPSLGLQEIFSRFRAWLLGVYKSLRQLNVTLTPEVTGVFDRMLATDAQIAAAEARGRFDPMFTTAESAGMTPGQFELYRTTVADAHRKAQETLDAKLQGEVRREQESAWKAERETIRQTVAETAYGAPVYKALAAIRFGTNPDGSPLLEGMDVPPLKLSRQTIVDRYGEERLNRLPKPYIYARSGGVDPDLVAERFGFSSGDELLTAIEQAEPMERAIDNETDRQMIERHGSLLLDGTITDEAQAAAANDIRDGVLRAELRALWDLANKVNPFVKQAEREGKAAVRDAEKERAYERRWLEAEAKLRIAIAEGRKQAEIDRLEKSLQELKAQARGGAVVLRAGLPSAVVLQQTAAARIARTRVQDINPALFWSASRRSATLALEHAARQDFDKAIEAKTNELLNVNLYREAERAKADVAKRVAKARDLASPKSRARIGLAGSTFLEQIDGILDRYNFAKISAKQLEKRARMRDWMEAIEAQGLPVDDLPPEVLDDLRRVDYQTIPYEELVGITDALDQIVHLARLKNRTLKTAAAESFSAVRDGVLASIRENNPKRQQPIEFDAAEERSHKIASVFAAHTKIATLARMLDGHKDGGAFWEAFIRPINAAQDEEQRRRTEEGQRYRDVVNKFYPGTGIKALKEKVYIPAIGGSLSLEARIAVALNWGNEISRSRIMADPTRRWSQAGVEAILATLNANDLAFVNATWEYIDHFWPEVAAKQKRVTGLEPEKVEGVAFSLRSKDGVEVEMRGGYYPLVYDSRLVARAQQNEAASEAKLATAAAYVRTTTRRGHTQARMRNVKLSVRLDLGVAFQHVDQVVHDLTHHETLIDVTRLLRDSRISAAILETRGSPVYQQFTRALEAIAGAARPGQMDGALNWIRTGTQLSLMGWNLWTGLQQPLGLFNGMERVGAKWVARGMGRWLKDAASLEATTKWIADVSPFMADRTNTATQDISDLRQAMLKPGGWFDGLVRTVTLDAIGQQQILDSYLWHIGLMQRVADVPTWLGGYEKAMADPANAGDEKRAIALADQAVRDSQGSGHIADLADVQRGPAWAKLFMTFYSYGNTVYNRTAANVDEFRSSGSVTSLLGHLGLLYVAPAVGTILLANAVGKRNDDDPEGWLLAVGGEILATAMNTMVLLREFGGAVGEGTRGYSGPAGARLFELGTGLATQVKQGKVDEGLFKALNAAAGIVLRYPAGQVQRTVDGFVALQEGRTSNPAAILFGAPPKKTRR